jgi:hypothetical protein
MPGATARKFLVGTKIKRDRVDLVRNAGQEEPAGNDSRTRDLDEVNVFIRFSPIAVAYAAGGVGGSGKGSERARKWHK